jgi:hypothetical protein
MSREFGSNRQGRARSAAIAGSGTSTLTRKQVAHRLGVAETSVRRLEGTQLHPVYRGRFVYFDEQEVESYATEHASGRNPKNTGEMAAQAFELFRAGQGFRDVVIQLRQTPERVRQLHREYALGSDLILPASVRCEIEELGLGDLGQPLGPQSILDSLRRLVEANRRLVQKTIDQFEQIQRLERSREQTTRAESAEENDSHADDDLSDPEKANNSPNNTAPPCATSERG